MILTWFDSVELTPGLVSGRKMGSEQPEGGQRYKKGF